LIGALTRNLLGSLAIAAARLPHRNSEGLVVRRKLARNLDSGTSSTGPAGLGFDFVSYGLSGTPVSFEAARAHDFGA
jgi:hypothetical protein